MSSMTKPFMAAIVALLLAAPFSYAGGKKEQTAPSTPAALAAPALRYFTGDGGRGMSLAVLVPSAQGISADQNYLPSLVQGVLVGDLTKLSAISVLDRLRLETVLKETESGIYRSEADYGRLGEIANVDYALTGSITKTGSGYAIQVQVVGTGKNTIGVTKAAYSGSCTIAELDNFTGIRKASLELLTQMGVSLTDTARSELSGAATDNQINSQTAVARGIVAQQQGTELAAMNYFLQAAAFDPSFAEAATRTSVLTTNISSGNIGDFARNDIELRRAWIARLDEADRYFTNYLTAFYDDFYNTIRKIDPSFVLYYTKPEIVLGAINYQSETANLGKIFMQLVETPDWRHMVEKNLTVVEYSVKQSVQMIHNGLDATGRRTAWGLADRKVKYPSRPDKFYDPTPSLRRFSVLVQLFNSHELAIFTSSKSWEAWRTISPEVDDNGLELRAKVSDITENMTVRIRGSDAATEAAIRDGVLQITPIPRAQFLSYRDHKFIAYLYNWTGTFVIRGPNLETDASHRKYREGDNIIIPNELWGIPVTAIVERAFLGKMSEGKRSLSVIIPNNITSIGDNAFYEGYYNLGGFNNSKETAPNGISFLKLGSGIKTIGKEAFAGNMLEEITIPRGVTYIGDRAFLPSKASFTDYRDRFKRREDWYEGLTTLTIPDGVTKIGRDAFFLNYYESIRVSLGANLPLWGAINGPENARAVGLVDFYINNGQKAGTYTYYPGPTDPVIVTRPDSSKSKWTYSTQR